MNDPLFWQGVLIGAACAVSGSLFWMLYKQQWRKKSRQAKMSPETGDTVYPNTTTATLILVFGMSIYMWMFPGEDASWTKVFIYIPLERGRFLEVACKWTGFFGIVDIARQARISEMGR